MSGAATMPQFLLLLHDDPTEYQDLAPEAMQDIVERYGAWARGLAERGILAGGHKLCDEGGRVVRSRDGRVVVHDGPYAEAKEVVSGYFLVDAPSYDAAVEIARSCPHAASKGRIEVRQIEQLA